METPVQQPAQVYIDRNTLKRAIISILVGAAIVAVNGILNLILQFLQQHLMTTVPTVAGIIHYLGPWNTNAQG